MTTGTSTLVVMGICRLLFDWLIGVEAMLTVNGPHPRVTRSHNALMRSRMHDGQVATDVELVRLLLRTQFPDFAQLPIKPVSTWGTDHDIYRLGTDLAVRLPIIEWAEGQAAKERRWLPEMAPRLPLAVPAPIALGSRGSRSSTRSRRPSRRPGREFDKETPTIGFPRLALTLEHNELPMLPLRIVKPCAEFIGLESLSIGG